MVLQLHPISAIQQPLPEGSSTGAGHSGQSGALGMDQRASTGLVTFKLYVWGTCALVDYHTTDVPHFTAGRTGNVQ
jgi:hypothetical protein